MCISTNRKKCDLPCDKGDLKRDCIHNTPIWQSLSQIRDLLMIGIYALMRANCLLYLDMPGITNLVLSFRMR